MNGLGKVEPVGVRPVGKARPQRHELRVGKTRERGIKHEEVYVLSDKKDNTETVKYKQRRQENCNQPEHDLKMGRLHHRDIKSTSRIFSQRV